MNRSVHLLFTVARLLRWLGLLGSLILTAVIVLGFGWLVGWLDGRGAAGFVVGSLAGLLITASAAYGVGWNDCATALARKQVDRAVEEWKRNGR